MSPSVLHLHTHPSPTGYHHRLRALLLEYPDAGVGEIGLCKSKRGKAVPMDVQEEVLLAQLRLAKVSAFCVVVEHEHAPVSVC